RDLCGQARLRVEDARPRISVGDRGAVVHHHLRPVVGSHARAPAPRGAGVLSVRARSTRLLLLLPVLAYTVFSAGPYVWTAMMSLRATDELYRSHYGLPVPAHWDKVHGAWHGCGHRS